MQLSLGPCAAALAFQHPEHALNKKPAAWPKHTIHPVEKKKWIKSLEKWGMIRRSASTALFGGVYQASRAARISKDYAALMFMHLCWIIVAASRRTRARLYQCLCWFTLCAICRDTLSRNYYSAPLPRHPPGARNSWELSSLHFLRLCFERPASLRLIRFAYAQATLSFRADFAEAHLYLNASQASRLLTFRILIAPLIFGRTV